MTLCGYSPLAAQMTGMRFYVIIPLTPGKRAFGLYARNRRHASKESGNYLVGPHRVRLGTECEERDANRSW